MIKLDLTTNPISFVIGSSMQELNTRLDEIKPRNKPTITADRILYYNEVYGLCFEKAEIFQTLITGKKGVGAKIIRTIGAYDSDKKRYKHIPAGLFITIIKRSAKVAEVIVDQEESLNNEQSDHHRPVKINSANLDMSDDPKPEEITSADLDLSD